MSTPHINADDYVSQAVKACQACRPLMDEILSLYGQVEEDISRLGAVCLGGGTCCRFDRMGHRLYASSGEIALLMTAKEAWPANLTLGRCPWQKGPSCKARLFRPLGCRTYFCDARIADNFQEIYEKYHLLVKSAHQKHCTPYAYVDLIGYLMQLSAT